VPYERLNREQITLALRRLGELAQEQAITLEVKIPSVEAAQTIHDKFFPHDVLSDPAKEVVRAAIQPSPS
jgi:hypothetical protein